MKKTRLIQKLMNNNYKLTCRSIYDKNTKRSKFKIYDRSKFDIKKKQLFNI